jgi:predicted HAD superfamily Cof-like phosphohydrolase
MRKALEQVAAFNRMVGTPNGDVAKPDATVDMALRVRLIAEEFDELLEALAPDFPPLPGRSVTSAVRDWLHRIECHDQQVRIGREAASQAPPSLPEVADALADLAFVTIGANDVWGIPGDAVWEEVCRANMAKLGGPKDPVTGKHLKPEGWTPPDIEGVLRREAEKASRRRPHQRGDQVARLVHFWENSFTRWLLDEKVNDATWWCYELHPNSGSIGKRELVDISVAPGILQPVERDRMPGE